jgi:excinuclease ABC subunit C
MPIDEKLKNLPSRPGVYLFKNKDGKVLYVGKAIILRNRVRSYFQKSRPLEPRIQSLVKKIVDLDFIVTDSEVEALILEANLIKQYKPRYNVNLKDDKSYPYIRITNEDFPQVYPTRTIVRDGSVYYGPYTNVKDMRFALTTLKRLFAIRSCKYDLTPDVISKGKVQLCLDYYIKKCKGPCQGLQSKEEYAVIIDQVHRFLKGRTDSLLTELRAEMYRLAESELFEDAARLRDKIEALEKYHNSQKIVAGDQRDRDFIAMATEDDDAAAVVFRIREGKIIGRLHYYLNGVLQRDPAEVLEQFVNQYFSTSDEISPEIYLPHEPTDRATIEAWLSQRIERKVQIIVPRAGEKRKLMDMCRKNARYLLEELKLQKMKAKEALPGPVRSLKRDLHLTIDPRRIECFDISNIQGTDPVASMVCFIDGKPKKSEYRRFKIQGKDSPDDFAMMREVIQRRYSRLKSEGKKFPDLIVVDGGKGQLSSAVQVLRELDITGQPIIGLAKRLEEVFFPGHSDAQMLPRTSSSLKLLQQIRDEAHRFAVTFHRQRRSKRTLTSELDAIEGIGQMRRNQLLKIFGSVANIRAQSAQELQDRGLLPEKIARAVYDFFHNGEQ